MYIAFVINIYVITIIIAIVYNASQYASLAIAVMLLFLFQHVELNTHRIGLNCVS